MKENTGRKSPGNLSVRKCGNHLYSLSVAGDEKKNV